MKTSQYGMYVLQVTNGIPDDFKHVFEVLPQRQPDIPTNFSASCDAPGYANLHWIPSFDGGDTQQFKLYSAVQDGQIVFIKHRMDIKENENEIFTFEIVDGLLPETSYVFKLIAYNTFGDSNFIQAYCNTTKSALEEESNIGLYIGASIGTFAAVLSIGLSVVVLFLRRKKYQEGLKDNILYESAGSNFGQGTTKVGYEVNDKKRHTKHGTDNSAFQETALYSVVQKKTGQDGVRIKENKDNDKGKTNKVKNNKNEDVQEPSGKESSKQNLNKDGLQYADLVFSKSKTGPKFVIRGLENRTIYAVVDTTQKIDPLPESDDEEPSDKNTNNEESGI
ncbi:unnamed protein product [Mytilus edulis]|uniref:Fibronectin type-III domain-containing protein n=1 Tax=Mytilus edulis TaxID=6550 RepID=A0A8S3U503_MYTED|nr:unnamed protein product [Mytilus edulis]